MPSKESLERGRKLRHKLRLGFQYAKEETAFDEAVADVLDEAIREARLDVLEHLVDQETIISFPMGFGLYRQLLVKDYASQLREGKT